jgi:branched-chain amino acid transport system ATP-binding protein
VLETRGLVKRFGGIVPTNEVSLKIGRGARHALIGPNGAGKTTLINLLTGTLEPSAGSIWLDGDDITHLAPHRRVRRGRRAHVPDQPALRRADAVAVARAHGRAPAR